MGWPGKETRTVFFFFLNINADNCLSNPILWQLLPHLQTSVPVTSPRYITFVRQNYKLFCWTIISVERQPTKEFQNFRKWFQKLFQKLRKRNYLKIHLDNILKHPLWHHTKRNISENCLKDAFCFLASHKRTSQQLVQCARHATSKANYRRIRNPQI